MGAFCKRGKTKRIWAYIEKCYSEIWVSKKNTEGAYFFLQIFKKKSHFGTLRIPVWLLAPSSTRGEAFLRLALAPPPLIRVWGGNCAPVKLYKLGSLFDEFGAWYTHNTNLVVNLENICLQKSPPEFSVILFSLLIHHFYFILK